MNIGTVNIDCEVHIINYQTQPDGTLTLEIFLEDEQVMEQLRVQARWTHLVVRHECFQSKPKYIDNSEYEQNTLAISLQYGEFILTGTFMQLSLTISRTPGESSGFFLTYNLVNLEE